jgi:tetratricopeptide (TPR) repeat protein
MSTCEAIPDDGAGAGCVGRARLTPGQLWQVPTFVAGLLAFLAVAASGPIRHPSEWRQFDADVYALRQALEKNQSPDALAPRAERLLAQVHDFGDRAAEVNFLAGSVWYRQALAATPEAARNHWPRVVTYLDQAAQLGLDESDLPILEYRLGWALYAQNRDVPRALELLARSVDRGAEQPLAGYRLLVQAYLKLPAPDLDAALAASRKIVDLTDDRDADGLAQARLAHAELLLKKDLRVEAIKELERIGARAPETLRLKARMLQVRLCEQEELWAKELAVWQELLHDAAHVAGGKARVLYAIGWCAAKLDDTARTVQAWQEALKLGGPAGQAAGLRLGGLRLFGPNPDATRALEDWRLALAEVQGPTDYKNALLELGEVQALFGQALGLFQEGQDYDKVLTVAELYRKLGPAGLADEQLAQAAEAQAKKLQRESPIPVAEVRVCNLRAAEAWEQAARARPARQGFDALWHSATCFLAAGDAARARQVLLQLERIDQEDARLGEGWFRLAEACRAAGQKDEAREAYLRSMAYATTPFAARARYQVALEAVEKRDWARAEETLQRNLIGFALDREAHEQSLYEMAFVQLQKHDFGKAQFFLNQATERYPNNPRALSMRGQLAECYRRFADQAFQQESADREAFRRGQASDEQKLQFDELIRHHQDMRRQWLRAAIAAYHTLIDALRERPAGALEGVLERRAVLGMADCHFELGEFLETLRLYQGLMQRHRATIESLIACHRIVQLKELVLKADLLPPEGQREVMAAVRAALPLAKGDLEKMDARGPDFQGGGGVLSWEEWQRWVAREQQQLQTPAPPMGKGIFP